MKIWQILSQKGKKEGFTWPDKESVRDFLYRTRTIPCETEDEFSLLSKEKRSELCLNVEGDCLDCLDVYLEIEV